MKSVFITFDQAHYKNILATLVMLLTTLPVSRTSEAMHGLQCVRQ